MIAILWGSRDAMCDSVEMRHDRQMLRVAKDLGSCVNQSEDRGRTIALTPCERSVGRSNK
jgi:hypothetical protein